MSYPWEEVHVPAGSYIGWGNWPGQYAMGIVISYGDNDGTTQKGEPCPETTLELVEPAASFDKQGNRTDYQPGAIVQITHSQVSSKKAARAADAKPGDLVKYTLSEYLVGQGKEGGDVKVFSVNIVRNYRPVPQRAPQQVQGFGGGSPQQGPPQFGVTQPAPANGQPGFAAPSVGAPHQQPLGQAQQYVPQQQPPAFGSPAYPLPPEPPQFGNGAVPQPAAAAAPQFGADEPPPF